MNVHTFPIAFTWADYEGRVIMEGRKQKADERYRQMFYDLGLDAEFEYLRFEKKDRLWFRCKKCGKEAPRGNDIFKGKQKKLLCRYCGNGMKIYSPLANEALAFYAAGNSVKETAERFNIPIWQLNEWAKLRKISNGREWQKVANDNRIEKARAEKESILKTKGIRLLEPYIGGNHTYKAIDLKTGNILLVSGNGIRAYKPGKDHKRNLKSVCDDPDIDIYKLIQRDGSRCYLCGKETDFNDLRWRSWGPDYPSIDHVTAIANGGRHSWSNVRVCCGLCNVRKGAKRI